MKALPRIEKRGKALQLVVDDHPFIILGGELHNSSGASVADMEKSFPVLRQLNLNTVVAPVSWELVEPAEGKFDFALVDGMIDVARANDMKLVLLWFGTWKNGKSCYVPEWVKTDLKRFPRVMTTKGEVTDVLSPFHAEVARADAKAFAALMQRVKKLDEGRNTVLMVQVENEVGILGQPRDFSADAEKAFSSPVPAGLMSYMKAHDGSLLPAVREPWEAAGKRPGGKWQEVFGAAADEIFMAWHMAGHLELVAAAGIREYAIPMYANAWLKQVNMMLPGQYPSGGPISDMLDIWRAAAPSLSFLAPDIYVETFKDVCASYTRSGNPLFIPEAHYNAGASSRAIYALAEHSAIGFSPFAIDDLTADNPLGKTYGVLGQMLGQIAEAQAAGKIFGFCQEGENDRTVHTMGGVSIIATSNHPRSQVPIPGGGFVIMLADDELLAVGWNYWLEFAIAGSDMPNIEVISVEQGTMVDGKFVPIRRLNGDETLHDEAVPLRNTLSICRAKLNLAVKPVRFRPEWRFPPQGA